MYLDVFTLSALVDEFTDVLVGGRVQDAIDVDRTGLGLEIYARQQRRYLYLNADHQQPRVHLVAEKLRRGLPKPTQIGLLFRRYVEGGIVVHVSQPAWERVLLLDIQGPEGDVTVIIEPMERRSNILLVKNGVILDCMRRVGSDENRYRVSLPNHEYVPPPPQTGKHDPLNLSLESMIGVFEQNADPKQKTQRLLTSRLLGISPLLAKEIVYRAGEDIHQKASSANPEQLLEILRLVVEPLGRRQWQPGVADGDHGIEAYSVYPLESLPGWRAVESVSEAMSAYYGAVLGADAYNAAKEPVLAAIREAQAKMNAKLTSLEGSLTDDADREILRQGGELILAYQYSLADGQTELRAQYDPDAPEMIVKLDPDLTALDNAQQYFKRYNKAKRALNDVPRLIRETTIELAYLAQLETDLELASNWPEIDEVQQALQSRGYWLDKPGKRIGGGGRSGPLKLTTKDGYVLWVGRNSRQNEEVTFKKAGGQDYWLHARDVPGAHVILRFDGRRIPESLIEQAASIAAYYSARRADNRVPVDVTRCKYVKKIKGAGAGMVTYRNEETITVRPQREDSFDGK